MAVMQTALEVTQPGKWLGANYLLVVVILELGMPALQEPASRADPGSTHLAMENWLVDLQSYPS